MIKGLWRTSLVNVLGTLGYISIIFQWLWAIVTVGHPLLSSDLSYLFPVNDSAPVAQVSTPPSAAAITLVIALTVVVFLFTFYVLWKLPSTIGKQGGRVTKQAASALIPIIAHTHKVKRQERRRLSRNIVLIIKATLITLPCLALIFAQPIGELHSNVIWVVGVFCVGCSLAYFALQQLCVSLWKIPAESVW